MQKEKLNENNTDRQGHGLLNDIYYKGNIRQKLKLKLFRFYHERAQNEQIILAVKFEIKTEKDDVFFY